MENNFKLSLIILGIAMALCMPLQNPCYADDASQSLNNDIAAVTKEPISKKKIAFKFIMAMVGVTTSSVIIYVGLSVYNKFFHNQPEPVVGLNSLRSPENFKESINLFLDKTNW